jgi:hypothetical protein
VPIRVLDPNLRAGRQPDALIADSLPHRFLID